MAKETFPNLEITYDTYKEKPVRTIIVKSQDTQAALKGATVTVGSEKYTTDDEGKIYLKTRDAFTAVVNMEGYMERTIHCESSTVDTSDTVYLNGGLIVTIIVKDQYGGYIQGAEVTLNKKTIVTESNGTATFFTTNGSYDYAVKYKDETQTGHLSVEGTGSQVEVLFRRTFADYKPTPNGNIQMLVQPIFANNHYFVDLNVESETTDYTIDWGDGKTTKAKETGAQTHRHEYAKSIPYTIEVSNCEKVTACNVDLIDRNQRNALCAYWSIGNSKVTMLKFSTGGYGCENLVYVGDDVFKNDAQRTEFDHCFSGCERLISIPEGLFDSCTAATDFSDCFSGCIRLASIPKGLFKNCTAATSFDGCFVSCLISSIPEGLFDSCISAIVFDSCFKSCKNLTSIPAGLFKNCTAATDFPRCFAGCERLISIPEGLFDSCTAAQDFIYCFAKCSNLSQIPARLFSNCKAAREFSHCFEHCSSIRSLPEGLFANCASTIEFTYCFYNCLNITSIQAGLFDGCTAATDFSYCFYRCSNLESIPAGLFDDCTEVTIFHSCFESCPSLKGIPAGLFANCTKVLSMQGVFIDCASLESVPEGLFDSLTKVTNFQQIFGGCTGLKSLPKDLFKNCTAVTNFIRGFDNCKSVKVFYMPPFEHASQQSAWAGAFGNCVISVLIVPQEKPLPISWDTFSDKGLMDAKIYVPDNSVTTYKWSTNWSRYADKIYPMSELPLEYQ
uniref:hypothetical protein n=1 Tax=Phocaeicola sp. TaxID=2773926 RepID=UPI003FF11B23